MCNHKQCQIYTSSIIFESSVLYLVKHLYHSQQHLKGILFEGQTVWADIF